MITGILYSNDGQINECPNVERRCLASICKGLELQIKQGCSARDALAKFDEM